MSPSSPRPQNQALDDELPSLSSPAMSFESPVEKENVTERDTFFYFDEVQFLVEDTLFKVPRHHFEQNSKVLHDSFYTSTTDNSETSDKVIRLGGISGSDFRLMLKVMFPESLWGQLESESGASDTQLPAELLWKDWASVLKLSVQLGLNSLFKTATRHIIDCPTSAQDWIGVLRITTEFEVKDVRETAIKHLTNIDAVEKIELAIDCRIKEWLIEGYEQLVRREEGISPEEESRLGWKTTLRLFKLRHRIFQNHLSSWNVRDQILDRFSAELEVANYSGSSKTESALASLADKGTVPAWVESWCFSSVIFLVERTLFKVPWFYFKQNSEVFGNMPPLPPPRNQAIDGSMDNQPFRLDGVRANDFRQLLRAVFRTDSVFVLLEDKQKSRKKQKKFHSIPHQIPAMSWKDWISVYELSDLWFIDSLRGEAITQISHLPRTSSEWVAILKWSTEKRILDIRAIAIQNLNGSVQGLKKIELARKFSIPEWLLEGYLEFIQRLDEVSEIEEGCLGQQTTSKLLRIRDQYLRDKYRGRYYHSESAIRINFEAELKAAEFVS